MERTGTTDGNDRRPSFPHEYNSEFLHSREAFVHFLAVVNRLDLEFAWMQEASRAAFVEARFIEWDGWNPAWETETARGIAGRMVESGDYSSLPLLADAIQDAGCEDERLLRLMRRDRPVPFVAHWWLLRRLIARRA